MLVLFFAVLAATNIGGLDCETCVRSNCKKTTGDFIVQYSSLTKKSNNKLPTSWAKNETYVRGKKHFLYIFSPFFLFSKKNFSN